MKNMNINFWRHEITIVAAFLFLFISLTIWLNMPVYPIDDAYITLHNAEVLLTGIDKNYQNVSPLSGATSLLHLLLIALVMPVFGDWASWIIAWFSIILFALAILKLAMFYKIPVQFSYCLLVVVFTSGLIWYQLLNGLETGFSMALIAWMIVLALGGGYQRSNKLLACILGFSFFVRPEIIILSGLIFLWKFSDGFSELSFFNKTRDLCFYALLGFLPFASYMLYEIGSVVPLTIEAKKVYFAEGSGDFWYKSQVGLEGISDFFLQIGFFSFGLLFLPLSNIGRTCLIFIVVFYGMFMLDFPGGLHHYFYRYQYLFIPIMALGLVSALASKKRFIVLFGYIVLFLSLIFSIYNFRENFRIYMRSNDFTKTELASLADWVNKSIPKDKVVLIHDAGYVAHFTDSKLVDFVGLKTPDSIAYHKNLTMPSKGEQRIVAIERIARMSHASYLIMRDGWESVFSVAQGLKYRGWKVDRVRVGAYVVYQIEDRQNNEHAF
jgi:hypothetical protein